jgi:HEAT repeat protein
MAELQEVIDRVDRAAIGSDVASREIAAIARKPGGLAALIEVCRADNGSSDYLWYAMSELGSDATPAIPFLVECVESDSWWKRTAAASVLASIGTAAGQAVPSLCKLVVANDNISSVYAAQALGNIGSTDQLVLDTLGTARDSEHVGLRCFARAALMKLGHGSDAVSYAMEQLRAPQPSARGAGASALGYLGPVGAGALPALRNAAAEDDNWQVRKMAEVAIASISYGK